MINHINIKDFAIIENTEIEFYKGLNIITGETGSGKSILLEAISLALGARADSTYVRSGADKALIQLIIETNNKETIITREISATGKNICKINGEIVTLAQLTEQASKLADIHGQYDHQSLLVTESHIKLVDTYEKSTIFPAINKVSDLYNEFVDVSKRLDDALEITKDNDRKKEFLQFEIDEISQANLTLNEDEVLEEELTVLQNKEKVFAGFDEAYKLAYGDDINALTGIGNVINLLKNISTISKDASSLEDEFSDVYYRFEDVCNRLRDIRDKTIYNESDIDSITDRINLINGLKVKYGETIDAIISRGERNEKELYSLKNIDADIESLSLEKSRVEEMLINETTRLTTLRKKSAMTLENKIQEELESLNFNNAKLSINFFPMAGYTPMGMDKVEFLISTNTGEALKPLSKIASGGEMSRIMLAFKKIIGEYDGIPTMIFDEIDSGISGETASIVGDAMLSLSESHQIIAITHLPQIAAKGDHNYRIEKSSDDSKTYTTVSYLNDHEKVAEIARLLSGVSISDITIQNAKEMIGQK